MPKEMVKKCPECGSINLFWNREKGEITCKDCGLVIEDKMVDFTQEWREFDSEQGEAKRRTGAPMTYTQYDQGLGTEVGQKADLFRLGGKNRDKFFRLRKWQYRISTAIERNLKLALAELVIVKLVLPLELVVFISGGFTSGSIVIPPEVPFTSSCLLGVVVPMPTLPLFLLYDFEPFAPFCTSVSRRQNRYCRNCLEGGWDYLPQTPQIPLYL